MIRNWPISTTSLLEATKLDRRRPDLARIRPNLGYPMERNDTYLGTLVAQHRVEASQSCCGGENTGSGSPSFVVEIPR